MERSEGYTERLRFRKAPLAAAAVWFALGVGASRWVVQPAVALVAALFLLCLIALYALRLQDDRGLRVAWLPVAALWLVAGLAAAEWEPGIPAAGPLAAYADGLNRTVHGRVTRVRMIAADNTTNHDPDRDNGEFHEEEPAGQALSVDLAVDSVEWMSSDLDEMRPMAGGLRAFVFADADAAPVPTLHCGDAVELQLRLKLPERYRDPGAFQYADTLATEGIAIRGSVRAKRVRVISSGAGSLRCKLYAVQGWAAGRMGRFTASRANHVVPTALRLDQADTAMLDAMLFGDRTGLNHALRMGFERTGSFHLFVVSGLHVALLAASVFWGMRRFRAPPWLATAVTLMLATAYALLTGFGQPVQRALAMTAMYLVTRLLSREGSSLNALGAVALGMLAWSPRSLFEASFQMTVLAVIAIAGIAGPLLDRSLLPYARALRKGAGAVNLYHPRAAQLRLMVELWGEALAQLCGGWSRGLPRALVRLLLWATELALIGLVAELVMVLPMATYFHRAAVFALPANMIVIPLIAVLAPAALLTFAASLVSPWAALLPAAATASLLHGVRWAIERLNALSLADVRVPGPVGWIGLIAVLAWLACCWGVRRGRWTAWATIGALPLVAALVLWPEPVVRTPDTLEVTALDVGQGDSLLVTGPVGQTMLVDAGGQAGGQTGGFPGAATAANNFDLGEEVVSPYLWSRRLRRLDVVALTHAHSDHMGGMPAVLRNFRPRELWVGIDPGSSAYTDLLAEAAALGIKVRHLHAGDGLDWNGVQLSVLSPAADYVNPGPAKNDDSLVMRLDYGAASVLMEGDAERRSEQRMVAEGRVQHVTLLKVGHHGSLTSTTQEFLAAASPQDAVISVGRSNTFGHPRREVIGHLAETGAHVYRTDRFGLTTFLLQRDGNIREVVGTAGTP